MTLAVVALGSNVGDRLEFLRFGARALGLLGRVVAVSPLYETQPIGGPEQEPFFNAVVVIDTTERPHALLDELHTIEAEAGRVRTVEWGPRTLDLDLILYGTQAVDDGILTVPHPRFMERRFVLEPLVAAWPEATTPDGRPVADLLPAVAGQEVTVVGDWWPEVGAAAQGALGFPVAEGAAAKKAGEPPNAATFTSRGGWWVVGQGVLGMAVVAAVLLSAGTIDAGGWLRWLGAIVATGGALEAGFGLLHLGASLTPYPEPIELGNLIHGGMYRYVRHPIYGGITLGMVGVALLQASWAGLALAIAGGLFFWLKAGFEERRLLVKYPGYALYRRRTPRRMIPWLL